MSEPVYRQCEICRRLFEMGGERHYVCLKCFTRDYAYLKGRLMRTPFERAGLVRVLEVEKGHFDGKQTVIVEHTEDHPHGYKQGSTGRYFAHELRPIND